MSMHNHLISESSGDQPALSKTGSHGKMWLDRVSCLGLTQLVQSLELLAYQYKCNGSPGGGVWARHSTTPLLLAVVHSIFSWSTTSCRYFASTLMKVFPCIPANSDEL